MNQEENTLPAGVTPEQIEVWKTKYGRTSIKQLDLPLSDDNPEDVLSVIARVPDRQTLGQFEKWSDQNPDKAKDILVTNCLLTGMEQVKANDVLFFTAVSALAELIPIRRATTKNL